MKGSKHKNYGNLMFHNNKPDLVEPLERLAYASKRSSRDTSERGSNQVVTQLHIYIYTDVCVRVRERARVAATASLGGAFNTAF